MNNKKSINELFNFLYDEHLGKPINEIFEKYEIRRNKMLNNKIKIKDIFDTFIHANSVLNKSYKQYNEIIKSDILFDFAFEFFTELEIYLEDRDDFTDLVEEFNQYECEQYELKYLKLRSKSIKYLIDEVGIEYIDTIIALTDQALREGVRDETIILEWVLQEIE